MTTDDVRARIEDIKAHAGDDEAQHSMEDELLRDVLEAIAAHAAEPAALAETVLATRELNFERWCA